jgi:uncharacterized protein YbbK (DUF523 family)
MKANHRLAWKNPRVENFLRCPSRSPGLRFPRVTARLTATEAIVERVRQSLDAASERGTRS